MERLSRDSIVRALEAVARAVPPNVARIELLVFGGAALVLLYGARETTKDVDAVVLGTGDAASLKAAAGSIATHLGLPEDWLNDGAKGYLHGVSKGPILLETPTLLVRAPAAEQLLAMKLCAWRDDLDVEDARLLLTKLEGERSAVWGYVEPYLVPGRELKARYAFDDLWEAHRGSA